MSQSTTVVSTITNARSGLGPLALLALLSVACERAPVPDEIDGAMMRSGSTRTVDDLGQGDGVSCAILGTGEVKCWGQGYVGSGGRVTPDAIDVVALDRPAVQVETSGAQTVVLMDDGTVRAWGTIPGETCTELDPDEPGAESFLLGTGPTSIELGAPVQQIAVGADFACALAQGGSVRCWGNNACGQLGRGDRQRIGDDEPVGASEEVDLGDAAVSVVAGAHHACAVLASTEIRCWGSNLDGQLGHDQPGAVGDDEPPSAVPSIDLGEPVIDIVAGLEHTCALLGTGAIRCWGSNLDGQLGYGASVSGRAPDPQDNGDVDVGGSALEIVAGARHTCARLEGGVLRCWGNNDLGQLGYGHTTTIGDDETPAEHPPLDLGARHAVALGAGATGWTTFVVLDHGDLRSWGNNDAGQLGHGNFQRIGDDMEEPPGELPNILVDDDYGDAIL